LSDNKIYIVDTDVISFLYRKDSIGAEYAKILAGVQCYISFMTLAEFDRGALKAGWGIRRRGELERLLSRFFVYHSDRDLCERWGEVMCAAHRAGRPINCADAWIAATALELECPLVTNNVKDYECLKDLEILTVSK
jgi:predicted nucleic acid-binding protein